MMSDGGAPMGHVTEASQAESQRLVRIELPEGLTPHSPYAEADRAQAVADLLAGNRFDPPGLPPGPYGLHLDLRENRLWLDIRGPSGAPLHGFALSLSPFRRLIKDYLMVVQAHEEAVTQDSHDARIQAIDMGRRGLHDEGAGLLRERLEGKVAVDLVTARLLFTLVCALHSRV
ncbi:UPF0262 family protein [Roseomonas gilardii]|uniref:UPF0262 family protein n=1 Tax=Roseomonas gilardii TaxID=257708 RepID=A0ABU3MEM9_9PROT|nr:UPF0262 family protein [Roseomonas gilardii]MDT8331423.1 UPF0262 family protein [Roseomonas gilardii]